MDLDLYQRAQHLVGHIKDMQTVLQLTDGLRNEATDGPAVTPSLEQLETSARNRLRNILEAIDSLPYTPPKVAGV